MFLLKAEQMKRYEKEKVGNVFLVDIVAFVHQVASLTVKTSHTRTQLEMKDWKNGRKHIGSGLMYEVAVIRDDPYVLLWMLQCIMSWMTDKIQRQ